MAARKPKRKLKKDPFVDLTWEDVEDWAGSKIVGRGRSYQRGGQVSDLGRTPEGGIIAWVLGSERYATRVEIQNGKLTSECTCPYWATCKHAVAVVLEYLECLKNKVEVRQISENDPRLHHLKEVDILEGEDSEDDAWEDEEAWIDEEDLKARTVEQQQKTGSLSNYLEKYSKAQLVELIDELAHAFPDVREFLEDRRNVRSGNVRNMIKAVRQEIANIGQPDWDDYGHGYQSANFDRLQEYLQALLQAGQADDIVHLGKELIGAAKFAVETCDHDGEVLYELAPCVEIVFEALKLSSLSSAEQLVWAVDVELADEYDLCADGLAVFWRGRRKKSDWGELADELQRRLDEMGAAKGTDDYSYTYRRDRLSNWLTSALEKAGRVDEIIPLCEQEAEITGNYTRLVDLLIDAKCFKEAENWCRKAIEKTEPHYFGTHSSLKERLRAIREKTGDRLGAVAFYADTFFENPSLHTFQELCKAARKARVGTGVEAWARHYLETGRLPRKKGRKRKGEPDRKWPLPETGFLEDSIRHSEGPITETLIEIAIAEKKPDAVLKWYDLAASHSVGGWGYEPLSIAEAIKGKYPDRAVEIWKARAESAISRVQVSGYQEAGKHLRKVRDTLKRLKKQKEWEAYLGALKSQNKNRPRCVEVLDGLSGKRIVDG